MIRLLILLSTVSGFCQTVKEELSECEITAIAVNSEHFVPWYDDEAKDGPVVIYDGAHDGKLKNQSCVEITIEGKGIVTIKPLDFEVEVNEIKQKLVNPRIILHKLEKTKDGYTIAFLYSELNRTLTLHYNGKGELTDYDTGAF